MKLEEEVQLSNVPVSLLTIKVVHKSSSEDIRGLFLEKSSDFIFRNASKAQLFSSSFKSLQKTKTVSQMAAQSVGQ